MTIERTSHYAKLAADLAYASPTISVLEPAMPAETIRAAMKQRGYTLGGGYGQWKETTFRIGHMGDMSVEALSEMLDVLSEVTRG